MAGNSSSPSLAHLVEAVDAGRGLLGDALDAAGHAGPLRRVGLAGCAGAGRARWPARVRWPSVGSGTSPAFSYSTPLCTQQRGVTAVVEDHVRAVVASSPRHRLLGAPPVLLERLALPGEHRDALRVRRRAVRDRRRRRPRRGPAWRRCCSWPSAPRRRARSSVSIEHGRLDRHVQRAGDAGAGQRLERAVAPCAAPRRPGISCSARWISRARTGRAERSATRSRGGRRGTMAWEPPRSGLVDRGLGPTAHRVRQPARPPCYPARPASRPSSRRSAGSARGPRPRRRPGAARSRRRPARGRSSRASGPSPCASHGADLADHLEHLVVHQREAAGHVRRSRIRGGASTSVSTWRVTSPCCPQPHSSLWQTSAGRVAEGRRLGVLADLVLQRTAATPPEGAAVDQPRAADGPGQRRRRVVGSGQQRGAARCRSTAAATARAWAARPSSSATATTGVTSAPSAARASGWRRRGPARRRRPRT